MVKIVGHRGARNLWSENSLSGFRRTAALGVEGVEFDVHLARDGGAVVIHDPLLERTAEGEGRVADHTVAELTATRLRDAGGDCVPTLEAVLDVFQETAVELHIEIKTDAVGSPYPGLEQRVVDLVRRRKLERRAFISCFAPGVVETAHRLWPQARLEVPVDRRSAEILGGVGPTLDRFAGATGCLFSVERTMLAPTLPIWLERAGRDRLGVWVPNEIADLRHWVAQPIYCITTDRPDLALQARAERTG
jgi:glycerophosphoryl diester phosphodiesterase